MSKEELKRCPFCGAKAHIGETEGCDWVITCNSDDCDATMFDSMDWGSEKDLKQELIDRWNKRV